MERRAFVKIALDMRICPQTLQALTLCSLHKVSKHIALWKKNYEKLETD